MLIASLAKLYPNAVAAANGSEQERGKLWRVNNTATTTIQDYLGSFMPKGGGFAYENGALVSAMEVTACIRTASPNGT